MLFAIRDTMSQVQEAAESLAGYVLELERLGVSLPAMRRTAETLGQIAMGWEAASGHGIISAQT